MRIVAFIKSSQRDVIEKILAQIGEDEELPDSTGPPKWMQIAQAKEHMEEHPDFYPDDTSHWDDCFAA